MLPAWLAPPKQQRIFINGKHTTFYQKWRVTFDDGSAEQKRKSRRRKRREAVELPPLTQEEVEKDRFGFVLIEKLRAAAAPRRLFSADKYQLKYQLPDCPFEMVVRIDNPAEVRRAYFEFENVSNKVLREMAELDRFNIVARNEGDPIFDKAPIRLVNAELRNTAMCTNWLAEQYLNDRVSLENFDKMMAMGTFDLRKETFTYVPYEEQDAHKYLDRPKRGKKISLEDQYKQGLITIEEFAELKYPERAAELEQRKLSYPRPEEPHQCVVCGEKRACIKCMECDNRVCRQCLEERFLQDAAAADTEAYLLLHHVHCLRFGRPVAKHRRDGQRPNAARVRDSEAELAAERATAAEANGEPRNSLRSSFRKKNLAPGVS